MDHLIVKFMKLENGSSGSIPDKCFDVICWSSLS